MVCWKSADVSDKHVVSIFMLDSCLVYSLTLRMETTCSSRTSADFQQTMRCCIREDRTLLHHHCKNPKLYIKMFSLIQSIKAPTFWQILLQHFLASYAPGQRWGKIRCLAWVQTLCLCTCVTVGKRGCDRYNTGCVLAFLHTTTSRPGYDTVLNAPTSHKKIHNAQHIPL
jgi:hypothetical protein